MGARFDEREKFESCMACCLVRVFTEMNGRANFSLYCNADRDFYAFACARSNKSFWALDRSEKLSTAQLQKSLKDWFRPPFAIDSSR